MAVIVGMEDRVDDFMRPFVFEDGQWYFQGAPRSRIAVSEDEVNQAEETFRRRFRIATVVSWTLLLGFAGWMMVQVLSDRLGFAAFLLFVPATFVLSIFYAWAGTSSNRAVRKRLMAQEERIWQEELRQEAARNVIEDVRR